VQRSVAPTLKAALPIAGPLVVQVGEALTYVNEIIPILKTLVGIYHERRPMFEEYPSLKSYLNEIQVIQ
jgi:hypothetical protein